MGTKDKLQYCVVTVTEGTAVARYRWNDNVVEGSDVIDDDVTTKFGKPSR